MATLTGSGWVVDEIPAPLRSLAATTWAALPSAASYTGVVARVSDVGVAPGILVISDGTRWVPMGAQPLARSAVAASVTGTVNETALATCTIPAGAMGLNGGIEVRVAGGATSSANSKTLRVRFGGIAGTQYLTAVNTTTPVVSDARRIRNRNSASSQFSPTGATVLPFVLASGVASATSAVDTTAAVDVVFTWQLASAAETATLDYYEVWLLP